MVIGALIGGGIALILAPHFVRARSAILAGVDKAKQVFACKEGEQSKEGIYCAVPEGADICYDEETRT
jgi:hypothetical protein